CLSRASAGPAGREKSLSAYAKNLLNGFLLMREGHPRGLMEWYRSVIMNWFIETWYRAARGTAYDLSNYTL
ncbi:MAG: hypothetical protein AAFO94_22565, partial [Bacteroidota bacterium]